MVLTFVIAFTKADTSNWTPFFPKKCSEDGLTCPTDNSYVPKEDACVDASWGPSGARRIVTGASNLFFVFIGYDVIVLAAEEVIMFSKLSNLQLIYSFSDLFPTSIRPNHQVLFQLECLELF